MSRKNTGQGLPTSYLNFRQFLTKCQFKEKLQYNYFSPSVFNDMLPEKWYDVMNISRQTLLQQQPIPVVVRNHCERIRLRVSQ